MRSLFLLGFISLILIATSCRRESCDNCCVVDETYVHKYGVAVPSDFWTESGEHGAVVSTMGDGIVITKSYASGVLDGDTTYSFPHSSQVQKKETYRQGTVVKTTEYFIDGTSKSETAYDSPLGMKTVSTWYLSGTPKSIEQYSGDLIVNGQYFTVQNQRDSTVENSNGTRLVRDDYGLLIATDTIQEGQLAQRTTYHPNGSPKEIIPHKNGLVDGTKKTFHPAGEPASTEEWAAGQQHGLSTSYQHGEKIAEVPYENGKKEGTEQRYRDGSKVVQEISWEEGRQHGPTTTHIGDNTKTDWYYRGQPTSKADYDFMINRPAP